MQRIATQIFIFSSLAFGALGILIVVLIGPDGDKSGSDLHILLMKMLMITVFIILPSFALSVAGKYLKDNQGG